MEVIHAGKEISASYFYGQVWILFVKFLIFCPSNLMSKFNKPTKLTVHNTLNEQLHWVINIIREMTSEKLAWSFR